MAYNISTLKVNKGDITKADVIQFIIDKLRTAINDISSLKQSIKSLSSDLDNVSVNITNITYEISNETVKIPTASDIIDIEGNPYTIRVPNDNKTWMVDVHVLSKETMENPDIGVAAYCRSWNKSS